VTRFRLKLEYDGGAFQGWQLQSNAPSVQQALEVAVEDVTGESIRVHGAGRTDAGVHALGQVAHLDTDTKLAPEALRKALNAVLPQGVSVLDIAEVDPRFHARHDAIGKLYRYRILNRSEPSPLRSAQTWHIRRELDLESMRRAALLLIGDHDFSAFRGTPGGSPQEETRRTLRKLDIQRRDDEVVVETEGRSFLRYMVRNIVGTLVEVGQGRRPVESVAELLESRDRGRAGPTAPAWGLCLDSVQYPGDASGPGPA